MEISSRKTSVQETAQDTDSAKSNINILQTANGLMDVKDRLETATQNSKLQSALESANAQIDTAGQEDPGKKELSTDEQKMAGNRSVEEFMNPVDQTEALRNRITEAAKQLGHDASPTQSNRFQEMIDSRKEALELLKSQHGYTDTSDPVGEFLSTLGKGMTAGGIGSSRADALRDAAGIQDPMSRLMGGLDEQHAPELGKSMISDEPAGDGSFSFSEAAKTVAKWALDVLGDAEVAEGSGGMTPPGSNEVSTMLDAPSTVEKVTGRAADLMDGFKAIFTSPFTGSMGGQDPNNVGSGVEYKIDDPDNPGGGTRPKGWIDFEKLLPEELRITTILKEMKGVGKTGGEAVNPGEQGDTTGGGDGKNISGTHNLTDQGKIGLIGQPEREQETGGASGGGVGISDPVRAGGNVDPLDGNAWTGAQRTEEPSDVQTTPTGDLSHLLETADDDSDQNTFKKRSR